MPPRGLYLWGDVGRGKSMLMDLFFGCLNIGRKRRVHFHEFMLEVHAAHRRGAQEGSRRPDPAGRRGARRRSAVPRVRRDDGDQFARRDDPVAAVHRADRAGVTVVTTSNRAPQDLYKNGLNREHFLPFIALVEERLDVLPLNGPVDYRRDRLGQQETWLVPNGPEATAQLSAAFFRLTDYPPEDREHVPARGI